MISNSSKREYPNSVYENAWEDLEVMSQSWIAVHGVDHKFCIEAMRNFANYLEQEYESTKQ